MPSSSHGPTRRDWLLALVALVLGLAMIAVYEVLKAQHMGQIGAPTDIGGGLIPVAGQVLAFLGGLRLAHLLWLAWPFDR